MTHTKYQKLLQKRSKFDLQLTPGKSTIWPKLGQTSLINNSKSWLNTSQKFDQPQKVRLNNHTLINNSKATVFFAYTERPLSWGETRQATSCGRRGIFRVWMGDVNLSILLGTTKRGREAETT